ncbi:hypothetical protein [Candidatus Mycolicibacterium alkanivorans]|uniref:Uncharacterized protein n=1 Tax=Candidatus Mycolicibacterium alkanivorans TaxID=2954114 RepID=A0ABS9YWM2_9MYCO|nr:hypothetical protein [Candidatus Mycolicibacterium alkanivorans]MCI4675636.1 hypothetical protein [Candidatus Mycolicibacterium alkanivorans]
MTDGPRFEKVTGLRVEDFKLLDQIGVFNPRRTACYQAVLLGLTGFEPATT